MSSNVSDVHRPVTPVRDVSFADSEFLARPWPELVRLQEQAPVYWSENQQGWIISTHALVKAAYTERRFSSARVDQLFRHLTPEVREQLGALRKYFSLNVNRLDGREHMRIRVLLMKAFAQSVVKSLEYLIETMVFEILDRCEEQREFDFASTVASVLPTRVLQHLLGLPAQFQGNLFKLASDFTSASGAARPTPELMLQLDRSIRDMNDIFNELIEARASNPGTDLISTLVHARDGLQRLSHDELLACFHAIIVAGAETTAHTLATGLVEIARQPILRDRLRDDPGCAFALTTELLRYPGTVKCMTRLAAEDFEFGGQAIRKGDLAWVMNAGANVDAHVFSDPFVSNIDRNNRDSMAFGPGIHHCVGYMLARTELSTFFARAFARFNIEILDETLQMVPSYIFFGYRPFRVRFTPR